MSVIHHRRSGRKLSFVFPRFVSFYPTIMSDGFLQTLKKCWCSCCCSCVTKSTSNKKYTAENESQNSISTKDDLDGNTEQPSQGREKISLEKIIIARKLVKWWRRRKRATNRWKSSSRKVQTLNRFLNNKNSVSARRSSTTSLPNLTLPKE